MAILPRSARVLRAAWVIGIAIVVVGSLLPAYSAPIEALATLGISDKLEHFAGYAALAFLPMLHERRAVLAWAAAAVALLGVVLEFGQLEAPGRSFELGDMAADFAGVCAGLLAAMPFRARVRRAMTPAPEPHPVSASK